MAVGRAPHATASTGCGSRCRHCVVHVPETGKSRIPTALNPGLTGPGDAGSPPHPGVRARVNRLCYHTGTRGAAARRRPIAAPPRAPCRVISTVVQPLGLRFRGLPVHGWSRALTFSPGGRGENLCTFLSGHFCTFVFVFRPLVDRPDPPGLSFFLSALALCYPISPLASFSRSPFAVLRPQKKQWTGGRRSPGPLTRLPCTFAGSWCPVGMPPDPASPWERSPRATR